MFSHMVSCQHEEALNYKFKHKRANKSLNALERVAQWLKQNGSIWKPIAINMDSRVATHKWSQRFHSL